jgi:Mycolic acid cyclopropane synthetase
MSDSALKAEQRGTWEAAAPGWAKWEEKFSAGLLEATDILLDMAGIKPGMRVLDLACGAGSQTLRAAARVTRRTPLGEAQPPPGKGADVSNWLRSKAAHGANAA